MNAGTPSAPGVHRLIVDGRTLQVSLRGEVTGGDGPPLLLLMGLAGWVELWDPLCVLLADRGGPATIAFDVPGVGRSPATRLPLSLCGMARLTAVLLDRLEVDRVDVLGMSWGGLPAQQLALSDPARVRRLVLVNTADRAMEGAADARGALPGPRAHRLDQLAPRHSPAPADPGRRRQPRPAGPPGRTRSFSPPSSPTRACTSSRRPGTCSSSTTRSDCWLRSWITSAPCPERHPPDPGPAHHGPLAVLARVTAHSDSSRSGSGTAV